MKNEYGVLLVLNLFLQALALDNGLGALPGLGWNSDYCQNCSGPQGMSAGDVLVGRSSTIGRALVGSGLRGFGGEIFVKHIADHMHNVKYNTSNSPKTLQELGFAYIMYVNMDASWDAVSEHCCAYE